MLVRTAWQGSLRALATSWPWIVMVGISWFSLWAAGEVRDLVTMMPAVEEVAGDVA
jgi:hypothetical protein